MIVDTKNRCRGVDSFRKKSLESGIHLGEQMGKTFRVHACVLKDRFHEHAGQSRLNSMTTDVGDKDPRLPVSPDEIEVVSPNGIARTVKAVDPQARNLWKAIRQQASLDPCRHFEILLQALLAIS
jgi:hypothetical protein